MARGWRAETRFACAGSYRADRFFFENSREKKPVTTQPNFTHEKAPWHAVYPPYYRFSLKKRPLMRFSIKKKNVREHRHCMVFAAIVRIMPGIFG
jgi:hypothetical protein